MQSCNHLQFSRWEWKKCNANLILTGHFFAFWVTRIPLEWSATKVIYYFLQWWRKKRYLRCLLSDKQTEYDRKDTHKSARNSQVSVPLHKMVSPLISGSGYLSITLITDCICKVPVWSWMFWLQENLPIHFVFCEIRASRIKNLGTCFFVHLPNNIFAYTILHLIFCAPQIVVPACVDILE